MIPLATTTITIKRPAENVDRDAYDVAPAPAVVAQGVRAHISAASASEKRDRGSQEVKTWHLDCDVVDLQHDDTVVDEITNQQYAVEWARARVGLGLDRMEAGLLQVDGHA